MVSGEMIWRCHLEVCRACSSSCLLFEPRVCHSCTSTTGQSSRGCLSRSPLQLQFFWVTVAPVTGAWRDKAIPSVLFCVPPAAKVVTKAGSRGWLESMGFAECKTRDWNIQGWNTGDRSQDKTVAKREQKAWRWVFHIPLICTPCALPAAALAPQVEGTQAEALESQTRFSLGLVRVALWDKSAVPQPGVYCCFTFGRELKSIWQKTVKLQS